jgi:hypothetical protein
MATVMLPQAERVLRTICNMPGTVASAARMIDRLLSLRQRSAHAGHLQAWLAAGTVDAKRLDEAAFLLGHEDGFAVGPPKVRLVGCFPLRAPRAASDPSAAMMAILPAETGR